MISNELLAKITGPEETVQWSGGPRPYSLFDASYKKSTMFIIYCAAAWTILTLGGYIAYVVASGGEIKYVAVGFLLAITCLILWMPISDKARATKLFYVVTDKRAIVVTGDDGKNIFMRFADIDAFRTEASGNGNCHVRLGSSTFKAAPRKLPALAYIGQYTGSENKKYTGLVFFNVSAADGNTIAALLKPSVADANA